MYAMTSSTDISVAPIEQLKSLSAQLSLQDEGAGRKALRLSKQLTAGLEQPETVAVELSFSVILPTYPST
jgi:hypothetical protein